tara:strand:+ start:7632 stop:7859 length:228 start_codon:yes stop_codon:yes gene_type:complete
LSAYLAVYGSRLTLLAVNAIGGSVPLLGFDAVDAAGRPTIPLRNALASLKARPLPDFVVTPDGRWTLEMLNWLEA